MSDVISSLSIRGAPDGYPTAAAAGPQLPDRQVTERDARSSPGLRILVLGIVLILAGVALAVLASRLSHGAAVALVLLCVLIFIVGSLALVGLTRRPRAGTRRAGVRPLPRHHPRLGPQWVDPFTRRIGCRPGSAPGIGAGQGQRRRGNPIEIAAVVVW